MTGSNLIVAAPWIAFAVATGIVCFLLFRSDRAPQSTPRRPPLSSSGPAGPVPRRCRMRRRAKGQLVMTNKKHDAPRSTQEPGCDGRR
jgi:hypothetical protein